MQYLYALGRDHYLNSRSDKIRQDLVQYFGQSRQTKDNLLNTFTTDLWMILIFLWLIFWGSDRPAIARVLEFVIFLCTVAFVFFARLDIMSKYIMGLQNNLTLNQFSLFFVSNSLKWKRQAKELVGTWATRQSAPDSGKMGPWHAVLEVLVLPDLQHVWLPSTNKGCY